MTTCDSPPPAACIEGTLRSFRGPGACDISSGACSYPFDEAPCSFGCHDDWRCRQAGEQLWRVPQAVVPNTPRQVDRNLAADDSGTVYLSLPFPNPDLNNDVALAVGNKGGILWSYAPENQGLHPTEVVRGPGGSLYLGSHVPRSEDGGDCDLVAILPSGKTDWTWTQRECQAIGPLAVGSDGSVYLLVHKTAGGNKFLQALSREGTALWSFPIDADQVVALLISSDNTAYVFDIQWMITAVRAGKLRWRAAAVFGETKVPLREPAYPALDEGRAIYLGLNRGLSLGYGSGLNRGLTAIDPDSGKQLWDLDAPSFPLITGPPLIDSNGRILLPVQGFILVISPAGAIVERIATARIILTAINLGDDGVIYGVGRDSAAWDTPQEYALVAYGPTGELLWRTDLPARPGQLLLGPDRILRVNVTGAGLLAFQANSSLATGRWPRPVGDLNSRRAPPMVP